MIVSCCAVSGRPRGKLTSAARVSERKRSPARRGRFSPNVLGFSTWAQIPIAAPPSGRDADGPSRRISALRPLAVVKRGGCTIALRPSCAHPVSSSVVATTPTSPIRLILPPLASELRARSADVRAGERSARAPSGEHARSDRRLLTGAARYRSGRAGAARLVAVRGPSAREVVRGQLEGDAIANQ